MDHPGAVVIVPVEDEHVLMVLQPREAVEEYTLELPGRDARPAGRGAARVRPARAGRGGRPRGGAWRDLGGFYTSPAILTEFIHCFLATDLSPVASPAAEEDEGIEVVRWPLVDLQVAIERVRDAKTLIGLMRLERELRAGGSLASRR